jgi:alkanesulfonate monooxygenase SsuD/methylene tetrahydromethanopterin reductase-like flavin-dependent oxidoreductase (luciferase family)
VRLSLAFNMRSPAGGPPTIDLYREALAMSAWADGNGFARIELSEHHNTSDGYLPSPIVMAAAVAARTAVVDIKLFVVLATLAHPIHLAEDLAVADLVSGGRLHVSLGAGYRKDEFFAFQVDWRQRPALMREAVATLRSAWTGEEFDFRGARVRVLPRPARPEGPPLALTGASDGAARRAAALDLPFEPLDERFWDTYLAELQRLGRGIPPRRDYLSPLPRWVAVAADPEKYWSDVGPWVMHNVNEYARYAQRQDLTPHQHVDDPDELLRDGQAQVYTPDQLLDACRELPGDALLRFNPLEGGIPPALGWESLRLFEREVLPHLHVVR